MKATNQTFLAALVALVMAAGTSSTAHAVITGTYVDADLSNTTPGASIVLVDPGTPNYDNLWYLRSGLGTESDNVLTTAGYPLEEAPQLTTTVNVANGMA